MHGRKGGTSPPRASHGGSGQRRPQGRAQCAARLLRHVRAREAERDVGKRVRPVLRALQERPRLRIRDAAPIAGAATAARGSQRGRRGAIGRVGAGSGGRFQSRNRRHRDATERRPEQRRRADAARGPTGRGQAAHRHGWRSCPALPGRVGGRARLACAHEGAEAHRCLVRIRVRAG